jgi:hypothetical protein
MSPLKIVTLVYPAVGTIKRLSAAVILLALLLLAAGANAAAYYSTGAPVSASPTYGCLAGTCTGVSTSVTTPVGGVTITASASLPLAGTTRVRYKLNGTALAGYRGGVLLSANAALLSLSTLPTITINTYLGPGGTPRNTMTVAANVARTQLLGSNGAPMQLELVSTADFDEVEVVFGSAVSLGASFDIRYAYGIGQNPSAQITGLTSNAKGSTAIPYSVTGCTDKVGAPANAVDSDSTNYATFSSLLAVNCASQLRVGLGGTAPATYRAGFVIGQGNNLLDAGILSSLVLKTYDKNGNFLEASSASSLLSLSVLPDGKSLVSFQASQPFASVAIERTDALAALDNLRLYYGVGLASLTPPQVISSFTSAGGHASTSTSGAVCASCGVTAPDNAAGSPNSYATVNSAVGVASTTTLRLDLNGTGSAGNRAGMIISNGNGNLIDASALSGVTLITYDKDNNVLETATGSSLLALNVLPNGRQTVSFNTTKDFAKVGIQIGGTLNVLANTNVYYAFTDNSNGSFNIAPPRGPLPVSLISFAVRRAAGSGAALLSWATASELNSASFVVERATNPAAGFVAIGQVAAAGSSSTTRSYSLADNEAATQRGTLYYRLRQLDIDGQAHLSGVVVLVAGPAPAGLTLYPNPAPASAPLVTLATGTDLSAGYSLELYSAMGQLLSRRVVGSEGATASPTVNTAGLAAGIYHVVLRNAAGQQLGTQRLQVAN